MAYLLHNIGELNHSSYNTREEILNLPKTEFLTFDGIYLNVYENKDVLKGFKPLFFVMGDYVGGDNLFDEGAPEYEEYCTWEQIDELVELTGGRVGWHTWSHPDLTKVDDKQLEHEVTPPYPMEDFGYPYGKFDDRVIEAVKKAGYKRAWSVFEGDNSDYQLLRKYL